MQLLVRRGLRDRLGRYVATGLAVVLGVALAVGSLVLTDTLRALLRTVSTAGAADVVVRAPATFDGARSRARIPTEILEEVRAFDGVVAAAGTVAGQAIVIAPDGTPSLGRFGAPVGVAWVDDPRVAPVELREGTAPGPGQVVLDRRTAERTGVEVGSTVGIVADGPIEHFAVAGVGEAPDGEALGLGSLTLFHPRDATRLLPGTRGFDSVLVAVDPERELEPTIAALGRALGGRAEVIRADDATRAPRIGFLPQLVTLFAGLGVVVGGFVVVNTFSMLIAQRVRELGLLRALGASVRQVRRLVLGEAVVLGFVSAVVGALAGAGIGWAMLRIAEGVGFEPPEGPVVVSGGRIVFGIVLGLVVTCGAAVVPALRASRVAPIDAMREDPRPPAVAGAVRGVIAMGLGAIAAWLLGWAAFGTIRPFERGFQVAGLGALVLFAAVIALGPLVVGPLAALLARPFIAVLGGPGRLARSNADRHRRRSAATAAALMAGIALVTVAAVISSSAQASFSAILQRNLLADYVVEPIGDRDVGAGLAAELRERAEVGDVVSAGRLDVSIDEDSEPLTVTDPDGLARMIDLRFRDGDLGAVRAGELLVGAREMSERGWRFGQELPVVFPTAGLVPMRIGAVLDEQVVGPGSAPINLLVADHVVADLGIERGDRLLWLSTADGVAGGDVEVVLDEVLASYPGVEWNDRAGYIAREIGQIEQFLGVVAGLVGLSVIIAVLGIANTLLLGVLERTREIGLLRAVGMSRRQVRTMVQAEGAILAALGALAGIGLGLLLAFVFGRAWRGQGFDSFAVPVQLLALVVAGAVATGVLAATIPARRAARTDVLEAIGVDFAATGTRN